MSSVEKLLSNYSIKNEWKHDMEVGLNGESGQFECSPVLNESTQGAQAGEKGFMQYLHNLTLSEGVPSVVTQAEYQQELARLIY